jgi:hypothetical protein
MRHIAQIGWGVDQLGSGVVQLLYDGAYSSVRMRESSVRLRGGLVRERLRRSLAMVRLSNGVK